MKGERVYRRTVSDHTSVGNYRASQLDLARAWVDDGYEHWQYLHAYLTAEAAAATGDPAVIERLRCRWNLGTLFRGCRVMAVRVGRINERWTWLIEVRA